MKNFQHIDCTLRDGGYYNNWFFSKKLVRSYISTMLKIGIKNIEIGFWSPKKNIDFGLYGNIPNKLLNEKIFNKNLKYGIMINCSEVKNFPIQYVVKKIKKISHISFVRIAVHKNELIYATKLVYELKRKNFQCMINLMQITEYNYLEIKNSIKILNKSSTDVLYFADSFGSMNKKITINILKRINKFKGEIGIHAHDNLGLALDNTLASINNNCNWIDTTVAGMGRGAGNTQTEKIIKIFQNKSSPIINNLIKKNFTELKKKYQWGPNRYYKFAGQNSIHPTYVQTMLGNKSFKKKNILKILKQISYFDSKKFDPYNINELNNFYNTAIENNSNISKLLNKKNVLICAPGNSLLKHKNRLINFIKANKKTTTTINLNTECVLPNNLINYYAICHPQKIYTCKNIINKNIILPYSMLEKKIKRKFSMSNIIDYGLKIKENTFEPKKNFLISPNYLVLSYVLGLCAMNNIQNIFIYGLDGSDKSSLQFGETQKILTLFTKEFSNIKIIFLNRTSYSI
jgi:4-hydroxy 2-oxovalerate aldolase